MDSLEQIQARLSVQSRAGILSALRMDSVAIVREPCNQHLDLVSERAQMAGDQLSKIEKQIQALIDRADFDLRFLLNLGLLAYESHLWLESIEPDTPLYQDLKEGFQTLQQLAFSTLAR